MATSNQLCNAVSVRLDDTNYHTWHFLMRHYLRGHGLLKFVDGSYHCPSQFQRADYDSLSIDNTGAFEKWLQQDSCVISLITASLSADALTLVIGCETSMEVWTTLKQHYAPKSEFHIMRLKSTLQNIRKGSDSIHKYLLRFKDVQNQLAVAGVRMSDEDMKTLILAGLPSEYAHTRQIIRGKNSITMEEVRCLLLSAEFEFEVEHKAHHLSPFTAMVAHNAITSGNLSLSYTQGSQFGVSPYNLPYVTSGVTRYSAYNMSPTCTSQVGYAPPPTTMTSNSGFVNPPTISVGCSQYSAQNFKGTFTHPSGSVAENGGLCSNFCSTNSGSNLSQQSYIGLEQLQSTPQFYRDSSHPQQLSGSPSPNFSGFSQNNLTSPQQFGASSHGGNTSQSQNNNGEYSYGNGGYSDGNTQSNYPQFPSSNSKTYTNSNRPAAFKPELNSNHHYGGTLICQICEKPGHGAYKCYQRNPQQQCEASSSIVKCQICKKQGHTTKRCRSIINNKSGNTAMVPCTDNVSDEISTTLSHIVEDHPHSVVGEGTVISELPISIPGAVSPTSQSFQNTTQFKYLCCNLALGLPSTSLRGDVKMKVNDESKGESKGEDGSITSSLEAGPCGNVARTDSVLNSSSNTVARGLGELNSITTISVTSEA